MISTLVIITNSAYCWLLSNFQRTPSFFSISFCYFMMQAFLAIYVCVCVSCLHRIDMALVFASHPQCNRIASTWHLFLQCACIAVVFVLQIFLLSSYLFLHHFVFSCFDTFLKSMFSCFINSFILFVQVFVLFCFGFACFKFSCFFFV